MAPLPQKSHKLCASSAFSGAPGLHIFVNFKKIYLQYLAKELILVYNEVITT